MHSKCPQFGWGCDLADDFCRRCKDKTECFNILIKEKTDRDRGFKPRIPKSKKPKNDIAGLSKPRITYTPFRIHGSLPPNNKKKVCFTVWIDFDWLKKQIGLNYFKDDN